MQEDITHKLKREILFAVSAFVVLTLFMLLSHSFLDFCEKNHLIVLIVALFTFLLYFFYKKVSKSLNDIHLIYTKNLNNKFQAIQKLQNIFEATEEMIVISDGKEILEANSKMLHFLGFNEAEPLLSEHRCISSFFVKKEGYISAQMGEESWIKYVLKHPNKNHKVIIKDKKSATYIFLLHVKRLKNSVDKQYFISFHDITELENRTLQLQYAIEGSNDGLWDWNLVDDSLYVSPRWKEMIGYKDEELPSEYMSWENSVHPDDLEAAVELIDACQKDPNQEYNIVTRLRHKDGHWVWILDRGQVIFDENGTAVRMIGFHTDISQIKELENSLQEEKYKFDLFAKNIPYAISVLDENAQTIFSNEREVEPYKTFITSPNDDREKKVQSLIEQAHIKTKAEDLIFMDIEDHSYVIRVVAFAIERGSDKPYTGLIYADITQEYKAQDEIRRLKSVLENSPIGIIKVDLDRKIEYVNSIYEKVCGYSKDELMGQNPRILKSGYTSDKEYKTMYETLKKGETWHGNFKNIKKDGSEYWESATIVPSYDSQANIDGYTAFKVEITENVFLEQKVLEQEKLIIAQSRHAAMGEMISMIAHQWRQPISVIAMDVNNIIADIELETLDEENLQESCNDILNKTQELSNTIDDFRNFFRPQKESETTLFKDLIDDTLSIIGKSLENNLVSIEVDLDKSYEITTYSRELMQVFINIIKNAKEVLVERDVVEKHIWLSVKKEAQTYIVKICDNGGGVKDDLVEKIFQPYFSTKSEKNGTGLGLYMSKTIVEKHLEGTLRVSNEEGNKTCFTLTLPDSLESN